MIRTAALLLLVSVCITSSAVAGEEGYRLWYAPYVVVKVEQASRFGQLAELPLMNTAAPLAHSEFSRLPLIGTTTPEQLVEALKHYRATEIRYMLLPPPVPLKALLSFRIPGAGDVGVRNAFTARAGLSKTVRHAGVGGRLYLATDAAILKDYLDGRAETQPWSLNLNSFLREKHKGLSIWLNAPWVLGIISYQMREPLTERLSSKDIDLPPALILSVTSQNSWSLRVPMPLKPTALTEKDAGSISLADTGKDFSLQIDLDQGVAAPGSSAFALVFQAYETLFPERADGLKRTVSALRLLTGAHIRESIASLFGRQFAVACWDNNHWAVASTVSRPEQLSQQLKRALNWLVFFARKKGEKAEVRLKSIPDADFSAAVSIGKHKFACSLFQSSSLLIVAGSMEDARRAMSGLIRRPAVPGAWLSWQSNLPAPVRSRMAMKMTSWMFSKKKGLAISQEDLTVRSLMYSNLLKLIGREQGLLLREREGIVLRVSGPGALVSGIALAATSIEKILPASSSSSEALAVSRLRSLLSAAQDYRHMGFGGGRYPERLLTMVTGTASGGASLSRWYNRRYNSAGSRYSYTRLLSSLEQGGYVDGYRFAPAKSIGGKPVKYASQWALVAVPWNPEDGSGLVVYEDGAVYRRDRAKLELPAKRDTDGWTRRE